MEHCTQSAYSEVLPEARVRIPCQPCTSSCVALSLTVRHQRDLISEKPRRLSFPQNRLVASRTPRTLSHLGVSDGEGAGSGYDSGSGSTESSLASLGATLLLVCTCSVNTRFLSRPESHRVSPVKSGLLMSVSVWSSGRPTACGRLSPMTGTRQ